MIFSSSIEPVYFILPVIGFIVGLLGTMLGGGGGFIFLPTLTLIIGVPTQIAVITSLVATLPICLIGAISHYNRANINIRIAIIFSVTGLIGALSGVAIAGRLSSELLKTIFGIYSILMALNIVLNIRKENSDNNKSVFNRTKAPFYGFFAGIATGSLGISATAPILAGLFSLSLSVKTAIGTSILIVLSNTLFAAGAHFVVGEIDMTLLLFLTIGSTLGALIGPRLLDEIKSNNSNKFKYIYAAVMAILGTIMILK